MKIGALLPFPRTPYYVCINIAIFELATNPLLPRIQNAGEKRNPESLPVYVLFFNICEEENMREKFWL